ncbi:alpha-L-fucosidase [Sphingobacterium yanglingense]|uniref:alpha-L-fucosidase n=1 Tax=Sphingobacterium yanglingense TaxID=1437280 RepID=A0A4R6WGU9_9SPHI|nr:alpha-L-fucosidase [Sphingobacterium yanglingense]TDQ77427.1 alpha-L-fucosidase [Sphingobacterium yanglingense]
MRKIVLTCLLLFHLLSAIGQTGYKPGPENLNARKWFEEARFGVFIHWGVYSILGDGEWVMNNQNFGLREYELLPRFFNPIDFNAKQWAKLFKQSGARYITFTSRHHDGFSMWHTKQSAYNVVESTPFKRDIVRELVDACREEGIKIMFYYSLLDWHRNDYLPAGSTGRGIVGRDSTQSDWGKYIAFMKGQLTELLTQYGTIDGIWFDGHWDKPNADWHYGEIYSLIHRLQPQCLIGNNHHIAPIAGEDFQMFERDLPGHNTTGFGTKAEDIGALPKEVCGTIAGSWGFDIKDRKRKSFQEVISYLIKAGGYGSNLLLNVGPMPNGEIQDYQQERLLEMGSWLDTYGESIYGTQGGFIKPTDDYAFTRKGNIVYLHVLNTKLSKLEVPNFDIGIQSMTSFDKNQKVKYTLSNSTLQVSLPLVVEDKPYVLIIKTK